MAGTTRRLPALLGEAVYCPAQAVGENGLSHEHGPIEVCRWRQGDHPDRAAASAGPVSP